MQTAPFVDLDVHHRPLDMSDRVALGFTKVLRFCADTFFARRYGNRAIMLETVEAVSGMVGATLTHLKCLRRMCDDKGWIGTLMEEAVISYTHYLRELDEGPSPKLPAPAIAKHYWKLADDLRLVA